MPRKKAAEIEAAEDSHEMPVDPTIAPRLDAMEVAMSNAGLPVEAHHEYSERADAIRTQLARAGVEFEDDSLEELERGLVGLGYLDAPTAEEA